MVWRPVPAWNTVAPSTRGDRLAGGEQPLDGVACARVLGVALRGHDHAHGGVAGEGRRVGLVQRPVGHGEEELGGVAGQEGSTTWASGSPKRTLYSMTLGPSGVSMSPA